MRVSVVKDQTVESLVRNLAEHLDSWGGAPLLGVRLNHLFFYFQPMSHENRRICEQ